MDKTLGYLRETLSNYTDQYSTGREIYNKLRKHNFRSEGAVCQSLIRGRNWISGQNFA